MGIGSVPIVRRGPDGLLALFLCVFFGVGTIVVGVLNKTPEKRDIIITGILQLLLSILIIGWIWAIVWGIMTFVRSTP